MIERTVFFINPQVPILVWLDLVAKNPLKLMISQQLSTEKYIEIGGPLESSQTNWCGQWNMFIIYAILCMAERDCTGIMELLSVATAVTREVSEMVDQKPSHLANQHMNKYDVTRKQRLCGIPKKFKKTTNRCFS